MWHIIHVLNFEPRELQDGYAPFSKHVFLQNEWGEMRSLTMPITDENRSKLRSGYQRRYEGELMWLQRWFLKSEVGETPSAEYLDVEVYSREQIEKEDGKPMENCTSPWIVVSVKGVMEKKSVPVVPATMINNAFGTTYGGSGVALDPIAYAEAAEFWEKNATVKNE